MLASAAPTRPPTRFASEMPSFPSRHLFSLVPVEEERQGGGGHGVERCSVWVLSESFSSLFLNLENPSGTLGSPPATMHAMLSQGTPDPLLYTSTGR